MANNIREHWTNARTLTFGTGFAMTGLALAAQIANWNRWITIGIGYGVGVAMMVFAAYQVHQSYAAKASKPNLLITACVPHGLSHDGKKWFKQHDGTEGTVVWVVNKRAGDSTPPASNIVAMLQFYDEHGSKGYFQRAHWLDTVENHVTIKVGVIKSLVLGVFQEGGYWAVFENALDAPVPDDPPDSIQTRFMPRKRFIFPRRISIGKGLLVTVSVSSEESGDNYARKTFAIDRRGNVTELEDYMKPEYYEGKEAHENFSKLATALFRAPKHAVKKAAKKSGKIVRTPKEPSKG